MNDRGPRASRGTAFRLVASRGETIATKVPTTSRGPQDDDRK